MASTDGRPGKGTSTLRVSICIPTYNGERFVAATIESALRQSFEDFELVVVDDASTDRTVEIVRGFADPRIILHQNAVNQGFEGNFNRALALARGDYVKVLPMDDIIYPRCIERQAAILDDPRYASVALVSCARDVIDDAGKKLVKRRVAVAGRLSGRRAVRRAVRTGKNLFGEPGAVLFRRTVLDRSGGFDGRLPYWIDLDLWSRMLLHGDAYAIAESLCAFRISSGQMSKRLAGSHSEQFRQLVHRLRAEPRYRIKRTDALLGQWRTSIDELARLCFYKLFLRP